MSLLAVITKDDDAIFTITLFIDTYDKGMFVRLEIQCLTIKW